MTQTIKERLQLLKKEEREIAIDDGSGLYELGFNAGVDACLPLLEEMLQTQTYNHYGLKTTLVREQDNKYIMKKLRSVEEIQDKMSSLRAKFVLKKIGYAKWANGVDKLLTQRDNQAYTSLVEGIKAQVKDINGESSVFDDFATDVIENVVKPLYGKK